MRRREQTQWQDPASGYVRRNLSPPEISQPLELVEVKFPAGARVAFENPLQETCVYQQVWILSGRMEITLGNESYQLGEGDCLALKLDQPIMFHNPTQKTARYLVAITNAGPGKR